VTLATPTRGVEIIEPFPPHALPRAWKWAQESRRQVADAFAPSTLDQFVEHWERQVRAGQRSWGVWRDAELGGIVTSMRFNAVLADAHCIFKRTFWGHETTAEALRLVFTEIFAGGVQKITTVCFSDNHALLGLVRRIGFEREGTLKKNALRDGDLCDQAVIGLTRDRFMETEAVRMESPAQVAEPTKNEVTECRS